MARDKTELGDAVVPCGCRGLGGGGGDASSDGCNGCDGSGAIVLL